MKNQKHKWTIEEEEALLTIFQEEKTIAKENPRAGPKVWIAQTRPNFGCILIIKY